jgi:AraC-like DNA-binding protein
MIFDFSLKSSLLLIFFVHGIIFSLLLFRRAIKNHDKPSLWLGFYAFLCVLYISPFMLGYAGWYARNPYRDILFYVPFQQLLLFPPVLYFYCRALFDQSFSFQKNDILHFVPAIGYILYSLLIFFVDKIVLEEYFFYQDQRDKDFALEYQVAGFVSLLIYLIRSLKLYQTYKITTYNTVSYADSLGFQWARKFILAFMILILMRLLFFVMNPEWDQFGRKFWYYLTFSALFYYITINGYVNSIRSVVSLKNQEVIPDTPADELTTPPGEGSQPDASNLSHPEQKPEIQDLDLWKKKIEQMMIVDEIYKDPELSIYHLAQKLNTHPKKISQTINLGFAMNFNDFVNKHRILAVIKMMEEGKHNEHTLEGLALDCGFRSKSTFNRAFKRHTQTSPREYIQKKLS